MKKHFSMILLLFLIGCSKEDTSVNLEKNDKKSEEVSTTESLSTVSNELQEKLEIGYEYDILHFNELYQEVRSLMDPLSQNMMDSNSAKLDLNELQKIANVVDRGTNWIKNMNTKSYSESKKYGENYSEFLNAASGFVSAGVHFKNAVESNNSELFFTGLESLIYFDENYQIFAEDFVNLKETK